MLDIIKPVTSWVCIITRPGSIKNATKAEKEDQKSMHT